MWSITVSAASSPCPLFSSSAECQDGTQDWNQGREEEGEVMKPGIWLTCKSQNQQQDQAGSSTRQEVVRLRPGHGKQPPPFPHLLPYLAFFSFSFHATMLEKSL